MTSAGVKLKEIIYTYIPNTTGCPKKHVTLFVNAVVFKPRRAEGWHYTHFKAGSMRLDTSTHTSHRCVWNLSYIRVCFKNPNLKYITF